ncbi:uncharacterized protein [Blastocystis hominis]|uniref:Glycoside hydrolase 35 catalytic domain-containing protein n=1 Tax=Blastocystis hominis TaxID=12968 RepID=D8M6Z9_BLAHO|nr:uncharacterized protein [Blastocystis hominis]CBK23838.2 unnamed protein product [Blastocystis hominis]|eukprot:XP_012897886.1 uncharacterized protein [Blastocystis hominis]
MLQHILLLAIATSIQVTGKPGFLAYTDFRGKPYKVTYDERSFFLDGKRSIFLAGSVHYPRATPEMWDTILDQAVEDGLNLIQIYTFWNLHEPVKGQYN